MVLGALPEAWPTGSLPYAASGGRWQRPDRRPDRHQCRRQHACVRDDARTRLGLRSCCRGSYGRRARAIKDNAGYQLRAFSGAEGRSASSPSGAAVFPAPREGHPRLALADFRSAERAGRACAPHREFDRYRFLRGSGVALAVNHVEGLSHRSNAGRSLLVEIGAAFRIALNDSGEALTAPRASTYWRRIAANRPCAPLLAAARGDTEGQRLEGRQIKRVSARLARLAAFHADASAAVGGVDAGVARHLLAHWGRHVLQPFASQGHAGLAGLKDCPVPS